MKITKKITTVGNSLGILIDKYIIKKLELKFGEYVEVDIKKFEENK
jgi:antitoxin component of MazEF toxin-antitoxin module